MRDTRRPIEASEYDVQDYVRDNFTKLGFSRIEGPRAAGPDFEGELDGERVQIEVERDCRNYVVHRHYENPKFDNVAVLIVADGARPRGRIRSLYPPRIIGIDQEDFEEWLDARESREEKREALLARQFKGVAIRLVKDGETVLSLSLGKPLLDSEIPESDEYDELAGYISLVANPKRVKVMQELLRRGELRFSEILEMTGNPKLVGDCVNPLIEKGMVSHAPDQGYRLTAKGSLLSRYFVYAVPHLIHLIQEMHNEALAELEVP